MNEMYAVIVIGLSIFLFLLIMLGVGEFYGGSWQTVAQGVAQFILLILGFAFAAFVIVSLMRRR